MFKFMFHILICFKKKYMFKIRVFKKNFFYQKKNIVYIQDCFNGYQILRGFESSHLNNLHHNKTVLTLIFFIAKTLT